MEAPANPVELAESPDSEAKAAVRRLQLSGALRFLTAGDDAESSTVKNQFGGTTAKRTASRPDQAGFLVETSTVITDGSGEVIRHEFVRVWTRRD
jgi:hypothetical protein